MNAYRFQMAIQPRRAALLACFLLLLGLTLAGCAIERESDSGNEAVVTAGRRLYVSNCTVCHGEGGDKVAEAPLDLKSFLDSRGDAVLVHVIAEGKGVMPAWGKARGGPLSRDEIGAVVAYLNASAGRTSPSLLANSGRNVYQQHCSRCHGERGDRIPVAPLGAKPFIDSQTDEQLFAVVADGVGMMPGFRTGSARPLTEDQVRAVVSYLRYNAEANVAQEARQGRELYVSNCLPCHGERGDRIPNVGLASADELRKLGDGGVTSTIVEGKGVMPAFGTAKGGTFRIAEVASLLAYLKSWAGLPAGSALAMTAMPSEGAALYASNCTGCHGDNGDKVPGVALKSHVFLDIRPDETLIRQISQGGAHGMPAWGTNTGGPLGEQEIKTLLAYLRSIAKNQLLPVGALASENGGSAAEVTARGKELFRQHCWACHGEGRDKVANANLADLSFLQERGDDLLSQGVSYGRGSMPSWGKERGGPLAEKDITAIMTYVKSVAGNVPKTGPATQAASPQAVPPQAAPLQTASSPIATLSADGAIGRSIFVKNCAACHGGSGNKMANANLADPSFLQERGDATLSQSIANGKGAMPSWSKEKGGMLSEQDIAAIIAFLKEAAGI